MTEQAQGNVPDTRETKRHVIEYLNRMIATVEQEHITVNECSFECGVGVLPPTETAPNALNHAPDGSYTFSVKWEDANQSSTFHTQLGYVLP